MVEKSTFMAFNDLYLVKVEDCMTALQESMAATFDMMKRSSGNRCERPKN